MSEKRIFENFERYSLSYVIFEDFFPPQNNYCALGRLTFPIGQREKMGSLDPIKSLLTQVVLSPLLCLTSFNRPVC